MNNNQNPALMEPNKISGIAVDNLVESPYLLLIGGDKSTQQKDIEKAKEIWRKIKK